jgi:16S rRNA processing protein RimM
MNPERVVVAEILRPRGIRGEVVARCQSDVPGRLEHLKSAQAQRVDGSSVPVEITAAWQHKNDWILKFSGVDSIDAAEGFRGADLWVPFANRATLAEGDFFRSDLLGCEVIDARTGDCAGTVQGWQECGGPPLMEVSDRGRERLVPFVRTLCEIDLNARTIRMDLPEGLLDL